MQLNNVSLLSIDCIDPHRAVRALRYSSSAITFSNIILFTSHDIFFDDIQVIRIPPITDLTGYSRFCLHELSSYISSEFIITIQSDGFIINPHLWSNEFLEYDYIGAPWPPEAPWCERNRVGNGGFSLRSRRLLELAARSATFECKHEDVVLTNVLYDYMLKNGCRYAPVSIAMQFALETKIPECEYDLNTCFGFHGKGNAFYHQGQGQQFRDRIALLDEAVR